MIVPVHNVAPFLPQCLASLSEQDYRKLEFVLVDDGSTDGCPRILADFAARDERALVVTQVNAGLGAARNSGLAVATGEFVTFVDSDDVVPPGSYRAMVRALRRSGSDFVVGCMQRMGPDSTWVSAWARRLHRIDRISIRIVDMPEMVVDVFACNKVFRREFFDDVVGGFPEGVRYEDQEPSIRAYLGATKFDVLRRVTYNWRVRSDGTSITQQKSDPADLRDRSAVMARVHTELIAHAPESVRRVWLAKALGFDLRPYFAHVPRTDDTYWDLLHLLVADLGEHADAECWLGIRVNDRATAWAALQNDRQDVVTILTSMSALGHSFPVESLPDGLFARPPYLSDLNHPPPDHLLAVSGDLELVCAIDGWRWRDSDTVSVRGTAYVEHLPDEVVPEGRPTVVLELVDLKSGAVTPVPVRGAEPDDPEVLVNDRWIRHAGARFWADIDTVPLREGGVWHLRVGIRGGGSDHRGYFETVSSLDSSGRLLPGPVVAGRRVAAGLRTTGPGQARSLALLAQQPPWVATHVLVDGLNLVLGTAAPPSGARWHPLEGDGEVAVSVAAARPGVDGGDGILVRVPLPVGADGSSWRLHLGAEAVTTPEQDGADPERIWEPVAAAQCPDLTGDTLLGRWDSGYAFIDPEGYVAARSDRHRTTAHDVVLDQERDVLLISGTSQWDQAQDLQLWLLPEDAALPPLRARVTRSLSTFRAEFTLVGPDGRPPAPGRRHLTVVAGDHTERAAVDRCLEVCLRREIVARCARILLARSGRAGTLRVTVAAPLAMGERGIFARNLNERQYRAAAAAGQLRPSVLFECFGGRFSGDSVKQLSLELARSGRARELGLELLWSVRDLSIPVPEGARPLVRFSREWFTALATSAYLVNNNNFPYFFTKAPGQVYVQTWHGTPIKRIGNDVPAASLSLQYRALMVREAQAWDYLIAGNQYSADIFGPAFGYAGPILTMGYPRNDPLVGDSGRRRREEVRAALTLGDDQLLVLYTPTWRDSARDSAGRYAMVSHLDPQEWLAGAPSTWVLGVRGHVNTSGFRSPGGAVRDLSAYPDVTDLYLAADVMVTDYSSTMFDFTVTGKPLVFLVPDLAEYRDTTRGLYFDLASSAPGPLVSTTAQVMATIRDLSALSGPYGHRYAEWQARFNRLDDGGAAARVVASIWDQGTGA